MLATTALSVWGNLSEPCGGDGVFHVAFTSARVFAVHMQLVQEGCTSVHPLRLDCLAGTLMPELSLRETVPGSPGGVTHPAHTYLRKIDVLLATSGRSR